MALSEKQQDSLIQEIEKFAQEHPSQYRVRVALLAILGYGYLFLLLAGFFAIVLILVWLLVYSRQNAAQLLKAIIIAFIPIWVILKSLQVKVLPPEGIALNRASCPKLFSIIDELTTKLRAPQFHYVLLTRDLNASVAQVPKLGIFGWQQNYLTVGLPLMQALSLHQFRAVLAHELGHLSGNHSRFGGWIYRVNKIWIQIFDRVHQSEYQDVSVLFNRFFNWYAPFFSAYSFVLRRMNEYEADRCAAELVGTKHISEALINIDIKARFLQESFWPNIQALMEQQASPPDTAITNLLRSIQTSPEPKLTQQWFIQALEVETNNNDTHPSLSDRLKALGIQSFSQGNLNLPNSVEISAAHQLFGKDISHYAAQFDHEWATEIETPWRQQHASLQASLQQLQSLESKVATQSLTAEEAWQRVCLVAELRGHTTAQPLIQEVLMIDSNHAIANYTFGQVLLTQNNLDGVAHIEKAIAKKSDLILDGCRLLFNFFEERGDRFRAKRYRKQAESHYEILLKAHQERSRISMRDVFQAHQLTSQQAAELESQLAKIPHLKAAYLCEKEVTYLPENPCCIFVAFRKISPGELFLGLDPKKADARFLKILEDRLPASLVGNIYVLSSERGRLARKIRCTPDIFIYRR